MDIINFNHLSLNQISGLRAITNMIANPKPAPQYEVKTLRDYENNIIRFTAYQAGTGIIDFQKTEVLNRLLNSAYQATKSTFAQHVLLSALSDCKVSV